MRLITTIGLVTLAAVALGVVFILPERVSSPDRREVATPGSPAEPVEASRPRADSGQTPETAKRTVRNTAERAAGAKPSDVPDPARTEAESLLAKALAQRSALENDGAPEWGKDRFRTSFPEALEVLGDANRKFDAGEFQAAVEGFRQALSLFDKLAEGKEERFRNALARGQEALLDWDPSAASKAFSRALVVKPGDASAEAGLLRAQSLPNVLSRMAEGRNRESAGDLDGARAEFRAALTLDPEFVEAKQQIDRVQKLIEERDFAAAVSASFEATESGRFGAADASLREAAKIRPQAPVISELKKRIRLGRQLASIKSLRRKAGQQEKAEEWKQAGGSYRKILSIDPSVAFAIDGKAKAEGMARLYGQVDLYLEDPGRLGSDRPLKHARQLVAAIQAMPVRGPKLSAKLDRLSALIEAAGTPRPVLLQSDGQTSVTVYRVARLGTLVNRRLSLRPGRYTAIGSRAGFRDVRVEFRVPASGVETTVVVKCVEKI